MLAPNTRRWLLHVARRAVKDALIERYGPTHDLPLDPVERPDDPALEVPQRVFVTWRDHADLVGCIGTVTPQQPLEDAIAHYAAYAAMRDPRTPTPLPTQWADLRCSISVLTAPRPLGVTGLDAITEAIVPFRDGVVIACGHKRALLLPSVWDNLPDRRGFMEALADKAGIDPRSEGARVTAEIFESENFGEKEYPIEG